MSDDIVAEIKQRLPIEEYIQKYVPLRRHGSRWLGLCPFHQEKTASFNVNDCSGFFYCFGCQASGDLFSFVTRYHGIDFKEALLLLAEDLGLSIDKYKNKNALTTSLKQQLFAMYKVAHNHFMTNLRSNQQSTQSYFLERGLTTPIIESFGLGYSLPSWDTLTQLLRRQGFAKEHIGQSGLVHARNDDYYDAFRDRYIFPIFATSGNVIAFGGRINPHAKQNSQHEQAKYINSPETAIYTKGKVLYGLVQARKSISVTKSMIITEGYFDVITLHQFGYTTAVAVLGTALTNEHAKLISSFASHVELVFDSDQAGRKASLSSARLLLIEGLRVQVVSLPEGEDIDSFLQHSGKEAFEHFRNTAQDGLDYCIAHIKTRSPKEVSAWIEEFINEIDNTLLLAQYSKRIAHLLGISEESILNSRVNQALTPSKPIANQTSKQLSEKEHMILKHMLTYPDHIHRIHTEGVELVLQSILAKEIAHVIATKDGAYHELQRYLSEEAQPIFAQLLVDLSPSDKQQEELQDILHYLQVAHKKRTTANAIIRMKGLTDIEGLARVQNNIKNMKESSYE